MRIEDAHPITPGRILVVDDEELLRPLLEELLGMDGHQVSTASDGVDAVDILEREQFDLVITDLVMPRLNGIEVLRAAKRIDPGYPVVVLTGYPSIETVRRLVNLGATDFITKPFNTDAVRAKVARIIERRRSPSPRRSQSLRPAVEHLEPEGYIVR